MSYHQVTLKEEKHSLALHFALGQFFRLQQKNSGDLEGSYKLLFTTILALDQNLPISSVDNFVADILKVLFECGIREIAAKQSFEVGESVFPVALGLRGRQGPNQPLLAGKRH
jgi:hypothetical protein